MMILELIKSKTEKFKEDFLKRYEESVTSEFNRLNEKYEINTVFKQIQEETGVKNIYHTRKEYNRAQKISDILYDFKYNRISDRIKKEVDKADKNFEDKQMRLAGRLVEKEISEDFDMELNSQYPNLDGKITDKSGKVVTFYTIVAEGPIQRPHYRYLVK